VKITVESDRTVELHEGADCWISSSAIDHEPVATIVIPSFCAQATLLRAVRSALDQTMQDLEVIVIDDASTDSSWALIAAWLRDDCRLRAIRHKRNCGKSVAMNRAISLARGRWLAVLDADDWYHPARLAELLSIGERRQVDMVADNQIFYDATADRIVRSAWPEGAANWELSFDDFLTGSNAYETFNFGMLKPILRMDFIRRTGLLYEEKARHGQDFFHLLQFYMLGGRAVVTDAPYYYYTQPFGSISRQWSHASRKRYDFQAAYEINQRCLDAASEALTRSQARRLRKRGERLKSLEYFSEAKERLAAGDWIGAMIRLARRPALFGYVLRRAGRRYFAHSAGQKIARVVADSRHRTGQVSAEINGGPAPSISPASKRSA
jgi:succinoglycan biosynthesis protein ExoO